jgi:very-short-patch-repair endonuclease
MFLDAFCPLAIEYGYEVKQKSSAREGVIVVGVQKPVGERYRADFLISYPFFGFYFAVVVECDGHAFHERTKQQAARDRQRDRALQKAGYEVFRFTGSELSADAKMCAQEVLDALMTFQTSSILASIEASEKDAA